MLVFMRELEGVGAWSDMRATLGRYLGLDGPVSSQTLARARSDDRFAGYLIRSRNHPDLLARLIDAQEDRGEVPEEVAPKSNRALLKQAGGATLRWAMSGFKKVDRATIDRRLAICGSCIHLEDAPDMAIYKVVLTAESKPRICQACGCFVSIKAAMATENCPIMDPERPGFSLWGESIVDPAA